MKKLKLAIFSLLIGMGVITSSIYTYNNISTMINKQQSTTNQEIKKSSDNQATLTNYDNTNNSAQNAGGCNHNCAACTNRCH